MKKIKSGRELRIEEEKKMKKRVAERERNEIEKKLEKF